MTRSWIVGSGLCSHLGEGVPAALAAVRGPHSSPTLLSAPLGGVEETIPSLTIDATAFVDPHERFERLVTSAVDEAIAQAGLSASDLARTALLLGTSSLDVSVTEDDYASALARGEDVHPLMSNSCMGEMGRRIARRVGVGGPDFTINTACTASANALAYADALVRTGRVSHAIVLGVELFNKVTSFGFKSLELLTPHGMRPFDRARAGLVLGEACAAVVITGAKRSEGDFWLRGSANMCDTHGVSAANPDGSTVAQVMRSAIASAGLTPADITAIKAHGTASLMNDEAEAAGLRRVFDPMPPVVALKPFIGHTFGACGLAELAVFCAAANDGFLPGTPGISPDAGDLGITLTQGPTPVGRGNFLLNYFGFGGNNTSLVVSNA